MPALIQICIVIVTIGLLAIVAMTVRMMIRISKATEEFSQLSVAARESIGKVDRLTDEAQTLVASLQDCVTPVQRVVERLEAVGQRTADLSSTILDELEIPVFTAAAVARGVRSGANHFLRRMVNRLIHRHTPFHGGNDHE